MDWVMAILQMDWMMAILLGGGGLFAISGWWQKKKRIEAEKLAWVETVKREEAEAATVQVQKKAEREGRYRAKWDALDQKRGELLKAEGLDSHQRQKLAKELVQLEEAAEKDRP